MRREGRRLPMGFAVGYALLTVDDVLAVSVPGGQEPELAQRGRCMALGENIVAAHVRALNFEHLAGRGEFRPASLKLFVHCLASVIDGLRRYGWRLHREGVRIALRPSRLNRRRAGGRERIAQAQALLHTRRLRIRHSTPMSTQTIDTVALERYLSEHLPDFQGKLTAEKFAGGQSNPTFLLGSGDQRWVLRRKPPGELLPSAHAVDREFRVLTALQDTDVPVARPHLLCEDDSVIGSMFYVMDFLDGRVLWDPKLPEVADPAERAAMYDEMNRVLAALHSVDPEAVGLGDFGRPGNYFERQVARWTKQYRASETETSTAMERLIEWLPANMPEDDGQVSLVHGDFRLDNLMFHATEPRIIGVLDWELSTLGHPLADLSYQVMAWQLPDAEGIRGLAGVDRQALGLPSDAAYIEHYCSRTGRTGIDNWNFYLAFCFFRLAAILQGVKKRALIGTASSAEAEARGAMVEPLAALGLSYIDA